jgi:UDP-3-O-[3-hydroxymyristoyl] glucosamine N-acyltransferase
MNITITKIINLIGKNNCKFLGSTKKIVKGVNPINVSQKNDLTFCKTYDKKAVDIISSSKASVIICHENLFNKSFVTSSTLIFVNNPRLYFLRCVKKYFSPVIIPGIDKKSVIHSKDIHYSSKIGPFVYVGKNTHIGKNCVIDPGAIIHDNTKIENNVKIHAGAIIGADGYGFEKNESNNWEKFPQIGGVEIQNNVEIGANSCIMKGALSVTKIGCDSKIGHLVNIGHNVQIGSSCMILPQTVIGGSSTLGNNVFVSMGTIIRDSINIEDDVTIGMGSVVTKNIPKNIAIMGVPAKPIKKKLPNPLKKSK